MRCQNIFRICRTDEPQAISEVQIQQLYTWPWDFCLPLSSTAWGGLRISLIGATSKSKVDTRKVTWMTLQTTERFHPSVPLCPWAYRETQKEKTCDVDTGSQNTRQHVQLLHRYGSQNALWSPPFYHRYGSWNAWWYPPFYHRYGSWNAWWYPPCIKLDCKDSNGPDGLEDLSLYA